MDKKLKVQITELIEQVEAGKLTAQEAVDILSKRVAHQDDPRQQPPPPNQETKPQ